jgi:hypothetical protein
MKLKLFSILACVCIISFTYASNDEDLKGNGKVTTEQRTVGSFGKISSAGSIDVQLVQGNSESVEVTCDENLLSYIITEVKDNGLSIHIKEKTSLSPTKLIVKVNLKNIAALNAAGSGDISTVNALKCDQLDVSQGGSGDIQLNITANKLAISKAGSGDFQIEGKAGKLSISSAGSGDVHAEKLIVENPDISMVGSGDIFLQKNARAKVSSIGSGDVHYE